MSIVYTVGHAILSPLGNTSGQNFTRVLREQPAIRRYEDIAIAPDPFYAARLQPDQLQVLAARLKNAAPVYSPFEQMCIYAAEEALSETDIDITGNECILILSSTKGNIEWLGSYPDERINIYESAVLIGRHLNMTTQPLVISNACISGSLALITAKRMLEAGRYKHAIVVGCDRLSRFVFSGFHAFRALSDQPCRPFDKQRSGINLGEAAACMVLSVEPEMSRTRPLAVLSGGTVSNDANHLSAPSRTGAELASTIRGALVEAALTYQDIGMISAHGTATLFNDEMEAKAIDQAGMSAVPLHSLKSYIGHTLGAAGIIESIIGCLAMDSGVLPASLGYEQSGVPAAIYVHTHTSDSIYSAFLKTASGFGGCNAALVWSRGS